MSLKDYPRRYCPACDSLGPRQFKPGPGGRPDAACPHCGSLERHRFLAILLACLQPTLGQLDMLLDIAPSTQVTPLLERLGARRLVRFDLGADNRLVDVVGSITEAPFADGSVDLMTCYHVLEHVPDDRLAMREIARVLRPGGLALLQVPFRPGTRTDEDPSAPPEVRIARFGQIDHVRYYGDDFEDRLVEAGLSLRRVTPRALLGESMSTWFKLQPDEHVWLATPSTGPSSVVPVTAVPTSLTMALDALFAQLVDEEQRSLSLKAEIRAIKERQPIRRLAKLAPASVRNSNSPVLRAVKNRLR